MFTRGRPNTIGSHGGGSGLTAAGSLENTAVWRLASSTSA